MKSSHGGLLLGQEAVAKRAHPRPSGYFCNDREKFDDFQAKARNYSIDFRDSRFFTDLIGDLKAGERCVVADIRLIHQPYRESALRALRSAVVSIAVQFQVFENQPAECVRNVHRNTDRRLKDRLAAIGHWSNHHSVPADAVLLRVWRSDS